MFETRTILKLSDYQVKILIESTRNLVEANKKLKKILDQYPDDSGHEGRKVFRQRKDEILLNLRILTGQSYISCVFSDDYYRIVLLKYVSSTGQSYISCVFSDDYLVEAK